MEKPINVHGSCCFCGKTVRFVVEQGDLERWKRGESYVQDLFPYLSVPDREFMISRSCGSCFDRTFADAPEDVDTDPMIG